MNVTTADIAIRVEHLSKRYRLGATTSLQRTFREMICDRVAAIWRQGPRIESDTADELWALRDISFEVARGEVLGIIGPNGAGKSTLLKILSQITDPTEGRAVIHGRIASLLEVGTGFHPELTGRENIFLNGAVLGMRKAEIERKFDDIVAFSGVERFLDTPVKRYSSGMTVRLAFAVAAHLDPEVLVIDEVLAVGDAAFQEKCLGKMKEVASGEGRTVLFVSHNMAAVQQLCDRVVYLESGQVHTIGPARQVVQRYLQHRETELTAHTDLRSVARQNDLGRTIRFSRCELIASDGARGHTIAFGSPIRVHVELEADQTVTGVGIVVGIDSEDGHRIATALSEDVGRTIDCRSGHTQHIGVMFGDLTLQPGKYRLSLGARRSKMPLDHLCPAATFRVSEAQTDAAQKPNSGLGAVRIDSNWEFTMHPTIDTRPIVPAADPAPPSAVEPRFYSQHGEDYLIWKLLGEGDNTDAYYVEVGALDGKRFSNTYALERLGWRGICVEAHPEYYEHTRRNRPNATVVHAACCDCDADHITFQTNDRGTLSAITPLDEQFIRQRFADCFSGFEPIEVPARTLTTILDESDAPRCIDVVSVDVEGNELQVLRGIDFDQYDIRALIVEANSEQDQAVYAAYLATKGYMLTRRVAVNLIFCKHPEDAVNVAQQPIDVSLIHTAHPHDDDATDVIVTPTFARPPLWTRLRRLLAG